MFHPLIRLLASKPHLVASHIGGYVELASAQAQEAAVALKARLIWSAGAAAGLSAGAMLAGVALLITAAVPLQDMPAPWLLVAAPLVPLLAGGVCWWLARRHSVALSLAPIRTQFAADAALMAEVEKA